MEFIEIIKIIILGIVEGITEWLPISSTGHMILVDEFIKLSATETFKEMFFVVIQLGAILAVVTMYFKKLWPFTTKEKCLVKKDIINLWLKVVVAVIPAAIIGILFEDEIDRIFYNSIVISITLIIYGVLFIIIEKIKKGKEGKIQEFKDLSYKTALMIGIFQVLALIPGTSRSGATILGAMLLGTSRFIAAEFSFFLAIPVMFGASLLKILKFGLVFTTTELTTLILGMVVAYVVSILAIKFLMEYIKKKDFTAFGYYRIILGIIVLTYFIIIK